MHEITKAVQSKNKALDDTLSRVSDVSCIFKRQAEQLDSVGIHQEYVCIGSTWIHIKVNSIGSSQCVKNQLQSLIFAKLENETFLYFSVAYANTYLYSLGVVNQWSENDNAQDQEEDEEHELLGGCSKGLNEDLESRGVSGQFEQPKDADDGEELKDVCVLQMGGHSLKDQIDVEAQRGYVIDDVDTVTKYIHDQNTF